MSKLIFNERYLEDLEQEKNRLEAGNGNMDDIEEIVDEMMGKNKKQKKGTQKLTESTRKKISDLTEAIREIKSGIELLNDCLNHQRQNLSDFLELDQGKTLNRQKHYREHTRKRSLSQKTSKRIYKLQMFSLPSDYMELTDEGLSYSEENNLLRYIVVNPEFISDDFLISLGEVDPEFTKKSEFEKLRFKIGFISKLKDHFIKGIPLQKSGDKKTTSRILAIPNGKIFLFKTLQTRKQKDIALYNSGIQVFHDIYSLSRSQIYTSQILKEKNRRIEEIKERFRKIIENWQESLEDKGELKKELAIILKKLEHSRNFFEQKIIEDRLKKIDFSHSFNDSKRIEGAFRDAQNSFLTKLSQTANIDNQGEILSLIISEEEKNWENFHSNVVSYLETLNQAELKEILDSKDPLKNERYFSGNKMNFKKLVDILYKYNTRFRNDFCPYPFSRFHKRIANLHEKVNNCFKKGDVEGIIEGIFYLNIFLKMQQFALSIYKTENKFKLDKVGFDRNVLESLLHELENIESIIKSKNFLEEKQAGSKFDAFFNDFFRQVDNMKELLKNGDIKGFIDFLERVRAERLS